MFPIQYGMVSESLSGRTEVDIVLCVVGKRIPYESTATTWEKLGDVGETRGRRNSGTDRKFTSEYGVGSARSSKLPVRPQVPLSP
jgi:hypothetical protein